MNRHHASEIGAPVAPDLSRAGDPVQRRFATHLSEERELKVVQRAETGSEGPQSKKGGEEIKKISACHLKYTNKPVHGWVRAERSKKKGWVR